MSFIPFLQAQGAASASATGSMISMFLPILLLILIMYFFMIRPQSKKQKETEKMLAALKKGDKVITIGGMHGVISSVHEKTVIIKVDDNAKIEFNRTAISTVVVDESKIAKDEKSDAKKDRKSKKEEKDESAKLDGEEVKEDSSAESK